MANMAIPQEFKVFVYVRDARAAGIQVDEDAPEDRYVAVDKRDYERKADNDEPAVNFEDQEEDG